MPRTVDRKEELRKFRLPLVMAAHAALKCKDCHFAVLTSYRLDDLRRFEVEVKLLPCVIHQAQVIDAMGKA